MAGSLILCKVYTDKDSRNVVKFIYYLLNAVFCWTCSLKNAAARKIMRIVAADFRALRGFRLHSYIRLKRAVESSRFVFICFLF